MITPTVFTGAKKIHDQINARGGDLLPPPNSNNLGAIFEPKSWERQTQEYITLGTTQFNKSELGRYLWKTELSFAAVFSGKALLDMLVENVRVSTFAILWSSRVAPTAEIQDAKIESIQLVGKQMLVDTPEARGQWALPAKPTPVQGLADLLKSYPMAPG